MANTKISADQVEELLLKGKSHGGVPVSYTHLFYFLKEAII